MIAIFVTWIVILFYSIEPDIDYEKLEEILYEFVIRLKRNFV